jgi:hypothetical protein
MEKKGISIFELKVFGCFQKQPQSWLLHKDLEGMKLGVAARTIRGVTRKLEQEGVLEQVQMYPGYRYRLAKKTASNQDYLARLVAAQKVLDRSTGAAK